MNRNPRNLQTALAMLAILSAWPTMVGAEPLVFEQAANVTGAAGIEADLNVSYYGPDDGYIINLPLSIRAGMPFLEGKLTVPYHLQSQSERSGLADLGLMLKSAFLTIPKFTLAVGLDSSLPTGEKDKYLRGGLQLDPFLAADFDMKVMKVHANLGYRYYQEYSYGTIGTVLEDGYGNIIGFSKVEIQEKPGDILHFAFGIEIPVGHVVSLNADLLAAKVQDFSFMGTVITGSAETLFTFVPGFRIHSGSFKAMLGVELPVENNNYNSFYRSNYNWRLLAGVGILFGL